MTRALIITIGEKGHYLPFIGPARALESAGVDVVFAAAADVRAELAEVGVRRIAIPPGARPPADDLRGEKLSRLIAEPAALRGWIRRLLVEYPAAGIDPMRRIIRDVAPDVAAVDTMAYDGVIAAELERVPWVGWATSLNPVVPDAFDSELLATVRALAAERRALFAAHGVDVRFRVCDALSPLGTAVFSTEALVGARVGAPPDGVELVGPSLRPTLSGAATLDLGFAGERPLVYVSFGSQAWHQPARYGAIARAARDADVAVVFAMGDLADSLGPRLEDERVRCVSFAPQLEMLARARLAITHAGANSVMECLAHGVPMLTAPLCNDQPHNQRFVVAAGAGRAIDLEADSPARIAAAIADVVGDGPERAAAARIADSYRMRSGADGAAALASRHAR